MDSTENTSFSLGQERTTKLLLALNECAEIIRNDAEKTTQLASANAALSRKEEELAKKNATIDKARILYKEAKEDTENIRVAIKRKTYRDTQIVRDRLYNICETVQIAGKKNSPIIELNNIIAAVEIIVDELKKVELWGESDVIPDFSVIPVKQKRPSSKKEKKTVHQPDENILPLDETSHQPRME